MRTPVARMVASLLAALLAVSLSAPAQASSWSRREPTTPRAAPAAVCRVRGRLPRIVRRPVATLREGYVSWTSHVRAARQAPVFYYGRRAAPGEALLLGSFSFASDVTRPVWQGIRDLWHRLVHAARR